MQVRGLATNPRKPRTLSLTHSLLLVSCIFPLLLLLLLLLPVHIFSLFNKMHTSAAVPLHHGHCYPSARPGWFASRCAGHSTPLHL